MEQIVPGGQMVPASAKNIYTQHTQLTRRIFTILVTITFTTLLDNDFNLKPLK